MIFHSWHWYLWTLAGGSQSINNMSSDNRKLEENKLLSSRNKELPLKSQETCELLTSSTFYLVASVSFYFRWCQPSKSIEEKVRFIAKPNNLISLIDLPLLFSLFSFLSNSEMSKWRIAINISSSLLLMEIQLQIWATTNFNWKKKSQYLKGYEWKALSRWEKESVALNRKTKLKFNLNSCFDVALHFLLLIELQT